MTSRQVVPGSAPSGFGFQVRSARPLRFLRCGGGAETLEVIVAPAPRRRPQVAPLADWTLAAPDHTARTTLYQVGRSFELWATEACAYRIDPEAGRIEMPDSDDPVVREQRLWAIPAALCLLHRGDIPLHAAAVEIGGRAVVLAGPSGQGKTTLALACHSHGFRVLSEDLTCCRLAPGATVLPGPALLRVRPDVYGGHPPTGMHVVAARPDRVHLAVDPDRRGSGAPVPLAAIVFLREAADDITLERIAASAAIPDLWTLSFHLSTNAARARAFAQLTRLAAAVPIWNLFRPTRLDRLEATVARVVSLCRP
jgi:hypothetical protein